MTPRAYKRARQWLDLAPCASRFVSDQIDAILHAAALPASLHEELQRLRPSWGDLPGTFACRFPVVAEGSHESGFVGGLLTVVSTGVEVAVPHGGRPAAECVSLGPTPEATGALTIHGLPSRSDVLVVGNSGSAAAWLAVHARLTRRPIPSNVVVSADLVPGTNGIPRLAPVDGGAAKARIVARELPGARFLLCGDAGGESTESFPVGASVVELERAVWGSVAVAVPDRTSSPIELGRKAFDKHDYASARAFYAEVADANGAGDPEQLLEACLRLAAIEVHAGRPGAAAGWYTRADEVKVPRAKRAAYAVERIAGLASQAIDEFRPATAREFLARVEAERAGQAGHPDEWERIQVLGARRRLHLLEGNPQAAHAEQLELLEITDDAERHRAILDLGFVELRRGDLQAAGLALAKARAAIEQLPSVYGVQSRAFLAWHVARLELRGGGDPGLQGVLDPAELTALIQLPELQAAGRWRVRAVRAALAGDVDALCDLAGELTVFQRWYLGVFLLEAPVTRELALRLLGDSPLDLAQVPELERAREAAREGGGDVEAYLRFGAY